MKDPTTHDITFKTADGGSLGAHRAIIAASSPVFYAMLYGKAKESKESEICLSSTNANTLEKIFTFIYSGVVQVSFDECLTLLQAAHYFDIAALETKCGEMLVSTLDIHSNFNSIITFAVEQQLDLLLTQCQDFMEVNAGKVINSPWFNTLPLHIILAFVKSSNLEVKEVDLFLAVARWYKHQEDVLSADDRKQVFQLIRYPLMSLTDLLEIVRPTQLADQNLYTAALEYNCMDMSEISKSEFPQDQLTVRRYYFNFSSPPGLVIEHTAKGTVITATENSRLCSMAKIYPTEAKPVKFKFDVKNLCNSGCIKLAGGYKHSWHNKENYVLDCEKEGEGSIMLNDNDQLITKIEHIEEWFPKQDDTCVMHIYFYYCKNTRIVLKRL